MIAIPTPIPPITTRCSFAQSFIPSIHPYNRKRYGK
jgi:hypothetical protein